MQNTLIHDKNRNNMTLKKFLTIVFLLLTGQIYAQKFSPDELTPIDKERVQQIQKEVDEINSMPLVSDTLGIEVIYFDKQGKLRKYVQKYDGESERGLTVACYNTNGDIIFYEFDVGSNCDADKGQYLIHNGRIVDGAYHYVCGCCEDEDGTLLNIDTTWRVKDTPFVEIFDDYQEWKAGYLRTESLLNYITSVDFTTSFLDATNQRLPGTIPRLKADQFAFSGLTIRYYDSLTAKEFGTWVEILDSIDHPKAYFLRIDYHPWRYGYIAVKKDIQYAVFPLIPYGGGNDITIERMNIDGIGSDELIARRISGSDEMERLERAGYDFRNFEERGFTAVWDLDALSCLLFIQDKYMFSRWRYDFSGNVLEQWSDCKSFKLVLDEKQLTIQKVKNCNEGILGLTYKYQLTESGFVLDSVE